MASNRRQLLLAGLGSGAFLAAAHAQELCSLPTPPQPEGPFHPFRPASDVDADLVQIKGHAEAARGEIIVLTVRVLDENCRPVAGALVDLWQACATGRYNHVRDDNTAALDEHFQYQALVRTNAEGVVKFRTIKPGAYPNDPSWTRPPHIHFKVSASGFVDLTTQMYFAGEALNRNDKILEGLTESERERLIVDFVRPSGRGSSVPEGIFDIVLSRSEA